MFVLSWQVGVAESATFTIQGNQMLNLGEALNKQRLNPCCYALRGSGLEGILTQGSTLLHPGQPI